MDAAFILIDSAKCVKNGKILHSVSWTHLAPNHYALRGVIPEMAPWRWQPTGRHHYLQVNNELYFICINPKTNYVSVTVQCLNSEVYGVGCPSG
jgi:hypothetical protein